MFSKKSSFIVGIDPAGIGTSGVVVKAINLKFPTKFVSNIKASNPVEAADKIIEFIETSKTKLSRQDCSLEAIVVEVPHGGAETFEEIKATRELVGILRYKYRFVFRGHYPNQKSKEYLASLKNKNWSSHIKDANAIIYAHLNEQEKNYICENGFGIKINGTKKV